MPESEYRFIRNQEKTEQLIKSLISQFRPGYLNRPETEYLTKIVNSHFVMDDKLTGSSHHMMMNVDGPDDGMCLCDEGETFYSTLSFFRKLAVDRQSAIIFYFNAQTYIANP